MRGFDLVLTYNWGAFDAVMARRLFGGPPLIHHEDGFNEDEAERLKPEAQPLPPARAEGRVPAGRALGAAGADRAAGLGPAEGVAHLRTASPVAAFAGRPSRARFPASSGRATRS